MIKMIVFDLGNVLLKDTGYIVSDLGESLSKISYESVFDDVFEREVKDLCKERGYDYTYLKEQLKNYFCSRYKLNLTIQEVQNLSIEFKLGIGSNFISDIHHALNPIKEYLSLILISGAMNVEKPDKRFFQKMIDEASYLGIFPREILFIDDKQENLQAARELNIDTLCYNNTESDESLYEAIMNHLSDNDLEEKKIIKDNIMKNQVANVIVKRDKGVLKQKLENQNAAYFNEICVGALPVLDVHGRQPTEKNTPTLDTLKELDVRNSSLSEEEIFFNEEMLMSLTKIEVPLTEDDLYPVYILLSYGATVMGRIIKTATHEPYSHGSIAFDSNLNSLYSFNAKGFVHEDIRDKKTYGSKEDYKYSLYVIFVNEEQLKNMDKLLDSFCKNVKHLSYSIKGCINNFFGKTTKDKDKYFCSQFVAEMIKSANEQLIKKDISLYTPYDLRKIKNCFFIQKGYLKNYDSRKVDKRIKEIKEKIKSKTTFNESLLSSYLKSKDNGDLLLRYKKINYKEEYNKSHRLLKLYSKTGDTKAMKEELAKLWSYYLIIEEIYVQKAKEDSSIKETKEYKDAIIAKAFILGDINTYLKELRKIEPNFDFGKYYEESKYNKDAILITKKDINKIIGLIKTLLF